MDHNSAPPAKRARISEEGDDSDAAAPRSEFISRSPQYGSGAADSITIRMVRPTRTAHTDGSLSWKYTVLHSFHPTFTHQVFAEEVIVGYRNPRITIDVTHPDLCTRVLFEHDGCMDSTSPDLKDEGIVADDVRACLDSWLPAGYTGDNFIVLDKSTAGEVTAAIPTLESFTSEGRFFPELKDASDCLAYGECAMKYTVAGQDASFELRKWKPAEDIALQQYHRRMAMFGLWFIETASHIDASDPKWTVLSIYKKETSHDTGDNISFVGYATAYLFTNPFLKGRQNFLRLAQMVILPCFQRQGHGHHILRQLQQMTQQLDCKEFNVEAPCRGMTLLRDRFDMEAAAGDAGMDAAVSAVLPESDQYPNISKEQTADIQYRLRLTAAQIARIYELVLMRRLVPSWSEEVLRKFRLMVKRRLLASDEELKSVDDATLRKKLLDDMWMDVYTEYRMLVKTAST